MAHKLAAVVHIQDEEHGPAIFGPDDEVPDWALPHIPNPKAWQGGDVPAAAAGDGETKAPRRRS